MNKVVHVVLIGLGALFALPPALFLIGLLTLGAGGGFIGDDGTPLSYGDSLIASCYRGSSLGPAGRLALMALTVLSLYLTAVWIERLITFMRAAGQTSRLRPIVFDAIRFASRDSGKEACVRFSKCPEAPIAKSILAELDRCEPKSTQIERLELAYHRGRRLGQALLRQGIPGLRLIAVMAPLISLIAAGIYVGWALYNSVDRPPVEGDVAAFLAIIASRCAALVVFGLIVSLSSLIAYAFLSRRQARLEAAMDEFAEECLALSLQMPGLRAGSKLKSVFPEKRRERSANARRGDIRRDRIETPPPRSFLETT